MRGNSLLVAALGLSAIAVAACGGASSATLGSDYGPNVQATRAPAGSAGYYGNGIPTNPGATPAKGAGSTAGTAGPTSAVGAPEDRIVKTGSVTIQVTSIDESVARATDQIHGLGGWLAGSDRKTTTASGLASVTYRVPVGRFEDALAIMRKLGSKVLGEHSDSASVGSQIVDLQARIDNLKASEKAIQAIMTKAITVADVLTVQQRLAEVQGQIEELTAQLQGLTDQSAYSTLTVIFEVPAVEPSPSPSPSASPSPEPSASDAPWSAGEQFNQAGAALGEVGKGIATVAIWCLVLILPVTLALVLLLVVLGLLARRLDPLRRRWLPFTVAQPVAFGQPAGYRQPNWMPPVVPAKPAPQAPAASPAPDVPGSEPK